MVLHHRYFGLAKLQPFAQPYGPGVVLGPPALPPAAAKQILPRHVMEQLPDSCLLHPICEASPRDDSNPSAVLKPHKALPLAHYLESCDYDGLELGAASVWQAHAIPPRRLAKYWKVFDVVTPQSTYSNCFTKHCKWCAGTLTALAYPIPRVRLACFGLKYSI